MNTLQLAEYRASLHDRLGLAGPLAIEMLAGRVAADPGVLLSALQAAGLLDETTAERSDLRHLRRELLAAAARSDAIEAAVVALQPAALVQEITELPQAEQEEMLYQVLALAGVAEAGPPAVRRLIDPALSHLTARAVMDPERLAGLSRLAAWLSDQLDLDEDHRASALLGHLAEAADLAAIEIDAAAEANTRSIIAALSASMGRSNLQELAEKLRDCACGLTGRLQAAEAELPCAPPPCRGDVFPERIALRRGPHDELAVCLHAGELFLEWCGPDERCPGQVFFEPDGTELVRQEETFVVGTALWTFGWPPPGDVTGLALHRNGAILRVSLDGK